MATTSPTETSSKKNEASKAMLEKRILHRKASLTAGESAFLHSLLIDPFKSPCDSTSAAITEDDTDRHLKQTAEAAQILDDDMLFSVPWNENTPSEDQHEEGPPSRPPKSKRKISNWVGLWKSFEEGVRPQWLIQNARSKPKDTPPRVISSQRTGTKTEDTEGWGNNMSPASVVLEQEDSFNDDTILSDEEVRADMHQSDESSASSWAESERSEHYDAWAVLKDEYAQDFGFDYSLGSTPQLEDDEEGNKFIIIGTSADDKSAQPHVMSPPLMDSLMNFLPEAISKENWWLKYSLVRDGASLDTFKRYVRGAQNTVLAIETTTGDVFGAFTASTWRTNPNFYGSGEAFLWKMRYNRMSPCGSLFEQAQLESDIDVYVYSHLNRFVQLSTHDMLAIGGGELPESQVQDNDNAYDDNTVDTPVHYDVELDGETGFGIALTDDLLRGTSSSCATFRNPSLVHRSSRGETFEVVNLEAWTFSPCCDVNSAEKLEMSKFFIRESLRSVSSTERSIDDPMESGSACSSPQTSYLSSSSARNPTRNSPQFSSRDFVQQKFYRRVGAEDENEMKRDQWAPANRLGGVGI